MIATTTIKLNEVHVNIYIDRVSDYDHSFLYNMFFNILVLYVSDLNY